MYFKYQLSTTSTVEKVMDDLVRAILPNPDLNAMSAECDKINSELINTVTSNWELWDRVVVTPGSNAYSVLRSLNEDGVTYKYLHIHFNTVNSFIINVYESWNKVTHAGTNAVYTPTTFSSINLNQSSIFYVFANNNYCLFAYKNTVLGAYRNVAGCIEFSRDDLWNTPALGYPCHAKLQMENANYTNINSGATAICHCPRIKSPNSDITAVAAGLQLITSFYNSQPTEGSDSDANYVGLARGANFNDFEIIVSEGRVHKVQSTVTPHYYFKGGTILGGLKFSQAAAGSPGDQITLNGINYYFDRASNTPLKLALLLPKQ